MSNTIGRIGGIAPPQAPEIQPGKPASGADFAKTLDKAIAGVEGSLDSAEHRVSNMLNGRPEELHSVIMETQRAGLQLELFLEVRNRVVQAYQEVMRAQV